MNCTSCGAEIPEAQNVCPACYTPARKPGLLRRIIDGLFGRFSSTGRVTGGATYRTEIRIARPQQTIRVKDDTTGDDRVYHSLDEVPPEIRARIEATMTGASAGNVRRKLTFRDAATGQEHTYNSVDELPPEFRAIYERMHKQQDQ